MWALTEVTTVAGVGAFVPQLVSRAGAARRDWALGLP